jgi:2-dehydropantoate 2-reductase
MVRIIYGEITKIGFMDDMVDPQKPLTILCFGMGAIGTYIGGSLAASGCGVSFIEQPGNFSDGSSVELKIRIPGTDTLSPKVKVTTNITEILQQEKFDIALLAIKAFDTSQLIENLIPYAHLLPPILCLQNGVENEGLIEEKLGKGAVIGASITTAVRRMGLGDIQLEKLRGVAIENRSPFGQTLIDAFNTAGLNARGYTDRDSMKWSKLLTNLQVNATSAILNWTPSQILSNPITYQIEIRQLKEALEVMRKMGLEIVDLPGTPVRLLISAMTSIPLTLGRFLIGIPLSKARGGKMPSLQIDLEAGRQRSEVEFLNGAVARFGASYQVDTPVNQALTEVLMKLAIGTLNKADFSNNPMNLVNRIEEYS